MGRVVDSRVEARRAPSSPFCSGECSSLSTRRKARSRDQRVGSGREAPWIDPPLPSETTPSTYLFLVCKGYNTPAHWILREITTIRNRSSTWAHQARTHRIAQIVLISPCVNRFPVALRTSSASSGLSSVSSVAICCSLEKDSRIEPEAKEDWVQR